MSIVRHDNEIRPFWARFFKPNWKFGALLIFVVCIPRFILVLDANASGSYGSIGVIMVLSALAPFIFLSKSGRTKIGIVRTQSYGIIFAAFILGIFASLILYYLGHFL